MKILTIALLTFLVIGAFQAQGQSGQDGEMPNKKSFTIESLDGLEVPVDYYTLGTERKGLIVLCHQAGWSRGEYAEIAPKLANMGYNCLAIDQRSGGEVNEVVNEAAKNAKKLKKPTTFLDAEQDIIAAVRWAKNDFQGEQIILWGSSYSASLVLKVAQDEGVDKVLAFSPGEYFGEKMILKDKINELDIPVFITCSKKEIERTRPIFNAIPSKNKTFFEPKSNGNHGSRALWSKFDDYEDYWKAVKAFLE